MPQGRDREGATHLSTPADQGVSLAPNPSLDMEMLIAVTLLTIHGLSRLVEDRAALFTIRGVSRLVEDRAALFTIRGVSRLVEARAGLVEDRAKNRLVPKGHV